MEVVVHFCSLGIWEAEKGGLGVQGLPQLHNEFKALSKTKQINLKKHKGNLFTSVQNKGLFFFNSRITLHSHEGRSRYFQLDIKVNSLP